MEQFKCEVCGRDYERKTWKSRKSSRFCSKACMNKKIHTWVKGNPSQFNWASATDEEKLNRLKEMYEKNVIRSGRQSCWGWKGSLRKGYGRLNYGSKSNPMGAHRASYLIHIGPIREGMHVLHKCDNRQCTNPDHLFLGSNYENVRDMVYKNRQASGSKSARSKLNEEQVHEIKNLICQGKLNHEIAPIFDVTSECIGLIRMEKNWKQVPWPKPYIYKFINTCAKLDDEKVREIKKLLMSGVKGCKIATRYRISPSNVSSIKKGITWKHVSIED